MGGNQKTTATDTIFALSSAYGKAGVSVFRISGPGAPAMLRKLTGRNKIATHRIFLATLTHPETGEKIDSAMAALMKAPHSYTGEDVAELFTHGSTAVADALYGALATFEGARIAKPGEFTKRAFLNGKLDLTQVEAVADLIEAETQSQRRLALSNAGGDAGRLYRRWRGEIVKVLAHTEAAIDFADDEMPAGIAAEMEARIKKLLAEIRAHMETAEAARMIRRGINVAIIGRPNAGKSSLFNRIAGQSRAIVSSTPGTTRDVIEAALDIDGFKINLLDTAGLNDKTTDAIEKKGIRKARAAARNADIRILVADKVSDLKDSKADADTIVLLNKIDRRKPANIPSGAIPISAKSGENFGEFRRVLANALKRKTATPADATLSRQRHKDALLTCAAELEQSLAASEQDLKAEHVRHASGAIASITGEVYFSELLDEIFSTFCLGK